MLTMRYTKRHKTAEIARLPRSMIAGGALAVMLVGVYLTVTAGAPAARKPLPPFSLPELARVAPVAADPADAKPVRLVYRNSVVPGGVHSAAELAAVIARDPIAAAHYANFNVAAAHIVRVEKSRLVHVSYRIGNQIYWTRKPVRLALGETLLSDGEHLIRTRCGNRLADDAQGPVLLNEPDAEVLETAFVSADDLIDQNVSMPVPAGASGQPVQLAGAAGTATVVAPTALDSRLAHQFALNSAMPGLSPWTSPVASVKPGRGSPALLVDSVANGGGPANGPAAGEQAGASAPSGVPAAPATPADPPAAPGVNLPGDLPAGNSPAQGGTAGPGKPGDVKIDPPTAGDPDMPFIDEPVFTPVKPGLSTTAETPAQVPEPGSLALAAMALSALLAARGLRRWQRRRAAARR